jgi:hypothetical protein
MNQISVSPLGKQELGDLELNFVSIKVPVFPVGTNVYPMKTYWFLTLDDLVRDCKDLDPLIIFDTTAVYDESIEVNVQTVPKEIIEKGHGYFIRAVVDIESTEWMKLIRNYFEPESQIHTFEFDFEHYTHPEVERLQKKLERQHERALEADKKQLEAYQNAKKDRQAQFRRGLGRR